MENNKNMTAVDWLEEQFIWMIEDGVDWFDAFHSVMSKLEQAKQMEKEQINKAWENGFRSTGEGWNGEIPPECQGKVLETEEYYNEQYGKQ